jgi:hypothetical protein
MRRSTFSSSSQEIEESDTCLQLQTLPNRSVSANADFAMAGPESCARSFSNLDGFEPIAPAKSVDWLRNTGIFPTH